MIRRIASINLQLDDLREKGIQRGETTGFSNLDNLYSIKQGSYTIILGPPGHGKSEIIFEILINQSIRFGKRHLIYSPETGSVPEIFAELIHKYTQKPFFKTNGFHSDDNEYYQAINWVDHHFLVVDSEEESYSFADLFEIAFKFEKENAGEKINCVMAEPYNELKHDMSKHGSRQDLYIEELMSDVRRFCKKNNKHVFLSIHPAHQVMKEQEGLRFYPMPTAREAAGGQALLRKAMTWINIWRPTVGLLNEFGIPYKENEVVITIEKAKPKGVSTKGTTSLFFDWRRNRYYEESTGSDFYAFEHETGVSKMMPSKEFNY